jgi:hypothetical protein
MSDGATADGPVPGPAGHGGLMAWVVVPAVLAGAVLAQTRLFRQATCETYDEFTYLRMGVCIFRHGDFVSLASPMTPPLPILLEYWLPALRARALPDTPGWESEVPELTRQARLLTSVLVGVPLVWAVHAWLTRRQGWLAGALGGGLAAFSPSILAASSIATTDACFALFAVLALAALHRYQLRPSRGSFVGAGAAMGLAMASKQSAVFLFPVALVELLLKCPKRERRTTRVDDCLWVLYWTGSRLSALIGLAFLVDWAVYGFGLAPTFQSGNTHVPMPDVVGMAANLFPDSEAIMDTARRLRPPLALDTFIGQVNHATEGHQAFLMGRYSFRGWWYFFPVAIAVKSTPAELVTIALAVLMACRASNWRDPARRLWLSSLAVMIGLGIASSINIGHRYMLLVYPLAVLLAVDRLGEGVGRGRVWGVSVGTLLLAWQAVSAVWVAPHYLSYFNSFCGGPSEGYRYLVDSSLDWGQDLPSLRRELEARGYHRVALCYFGTAKPFAYGIRSADWLWAGEPDRSECDWLAISATALQGAYSGSSVVSERFRGLESGRAGYTIFLYDLKDPRVRAALEASRERSEPRAPMAAPPVLPDRRGF